VSTTIIGPYWRVLWGAGDTLQLDRALKCCKWIRRRGRVGCSMAKLCHKSDMIALRGMGCNALTSAHKNHFAMETVSSGHNNRIDLPNRLSALGAQWSEHLGPVAHMTFTNVSSIMNYVPLDLPITARNLLLIDTIIALVPIYFKANHHTCLLCFSLYHLCVNRKDKLSGCNVRTNEIDCVEALWQTPINSNRKCGRAGCSDPTSAAEEMKKFAPTRTL